MWILQARILQWVVRSSSRGSSQPRDQTQPGLPHHWWILYHLSHQGSPSFSLLLIYQGPKYLPLGKYVKDTKTNKFKALKKHESYIPLQSPVITIILTISQVEISNISQTNTCQMHKWIYLNLISFSISYKQNSKNILCSKPATICHLWTYSFG